MKKLKLPLSKLSFIVSIFTIIAITFTLIGIATYEYKSYYTSKIEEIKKAYREKNEAILKEEVTFEIKRINNLVADFYYSIFSVIDNRIETVENIFNSNKKTHGIASDIFLQKHFYEVLDSLTYNSTKGFLYIFDKDGKILYHHYDKKLVGKNILKSNFLGDDAKSILSKAIALDYAYGSYKIEEKGNELKIYTHIKKIDDFYIASCVYVEVLEAELQKSIFKALSQRRFGLDGHGYFWIINSSYKMIFHPIQPELIDVSLENFTTKKGVKLFANIQSMLKDKDETFIEYDWEIPETDEVTRKISFVKKVGKWDWILGAGFYFKDLEYMLEKEKKQVEDFFKALAIKVATILLVLFTILITISLYISKKFEGIEYMQRKYLNLLEQYKKILDMSTIVSKTDSKGRITEVNELFEKVSGYSKEEVIGKAHRIVRHPSTPKETFEDMWKVITTGNIWQGVLKNQCKDKDKSYINQVMIFPMKNEDDEIMEYISASIDITEVIEQKDKIENLFLTDSLTGLGSRIKLLDTISKCTKDSFVCLVDIDRFTEINDMYGNQVGDEILKEVAKNIFNYSRAYDMYIFRMYADVFAVYSSKSTLSEFESFIQGLLASLSTKNYHTMYPDFSLSFTAGVAYGDNEIMVCADMALKSAKKNKKSIVVYDESNSIINEFSDNLLWMKKLNKAIQENRIVPFYQPIYNLKTEKIEKYEVLMRYIETDGTEVSPFKFLDIAKKTKIYPELTISVVEQAVNYFKDKRHLFFSINLTLEDLLNHGTMNYIYSILKQHQLFENIIFEIVESEELASFEQVEDVLARFKTEGVKIAIDDFGSGYSNYNYLLKLHVDYIKIDGSIVQTLAVKKSTVDLVSSIVDFAQKSNIKTIAEFVSDEMIDKIVRELHVDCAQGYHYGKPAKNI